MKTCSKCKKEKTLEEFYRRKTSKDGRKSECKECAKQYYENNREKFRENGKRFYENNKEKVLEQKKQWYENNKERIREQRRQFRENNREEILERQRQWRENNREYQKQWYENNKEEILERQRQYLNQRRKNDPKHRLRMNISVAFYHFLKGGKNKPTSEYLKQCGYTREELMKHLEDQFDQNMTWDNYGSYWHIDHIIPQSVFEPTNDQHLKWCWSLENLRPMEASENMSKNNRIILELVEKISFYQDIQNLL